MKIITLLLLCISFTSGYKILFLVPIAGKSHWVYLENFVRALLERKHEVTCVTNFAWNGPKPDNYTEVLIEKPLDMHKIFSANSTNSMILSKYFNNDWVMAAIFPLMGSYSSDHVLSDPNVQKFIHRNDLQFDLIINEEVFHDSFLMFAHKYKAPIITICPYGITDFFDRQMGLLTPYSYVPHTILSYTDEMTFTQRWYNTILSLYDWMLRRFYHIPKQNEIAKKYFAHLEPLPSIDDLIKNVSLIFVNAHRSITPAKPSMPSLIYVGGAHVKKPKLLPSDLKTFMDEAENGVIYFSFGTMIKLSKIAPEKLNVLLGVFKTLKQRVIWKLEDENLKNVPSNVMIRQWLPQNDILAHPNVVLFISHGGMFSNFEAITYGIPILMVPFAGDQHRNALRAETAGYAKYIEFRDITEQSLLSTIQEMIDNEYYLRRAKAISAIYNDNLVHPMDETMFWIEYVCRHKGAKHLKSHAIDMSWFSYLLLDVILVTIVAVVLTIFLMHFILLRLCRRSTKFSQKMKTN